MRHRGSSRHRLSAGLLAVVVALAGCTTQSSPSPSGPGLQSGPPAAASPTPSVAAIPFARLSSATPVVNLDPVVGTDAASSQVIVLTGGQLLRWDAAGVPQLDLASGVTAAADGLQVTVQLRPNLRYSDGTPIRALDVVTAFQRQQKGGSFATFLGPVTAVRAPDDTTAVFTLSSPFPDFSNMLASRIIVLHPTDKISGDSKYFSHPVSGGPYTAINWTPGDQTMTLEENKNYPGGPMAIQKMEVVAVPDPTSRILQLSTGRLDWSYDLPLANAADLPSTVRGKAEAISGTYIVMFNVSREGPISNSKVRQAISLGIDRSRVRDVAFFGATPVSASWFSDCANDPLCQAALPNGGARDVQAARTLLAQTPYASGFSFKLQTASDRPGWKEAAVVIAESLKDIGAKVEVVTFEQAARVANENSGNFDGSFTGTSGTPLEAAQLLWGAKGAVTARSRYNNPAIQQLVDQAASELDVPKRRTLFTQIQSLAYQDMAVIPVTDRVALVGSRVAAPDPIRLVRNSFYIRIAPLAELGR